MSLKIISSLSLAVLLFSYPGEATFAMEHNSDKAPAGFKSTTYDAAEVEAQTLTVPADAVTQPLVRDTYSATTPEEIAAKKAAEAAEAKRKADEAARQKMLENSKAIYGTSSYANVRDLNSKAGCSAGSICWPLDGFTFGDRNTFRPPARPDHKGFDMLAPAMTPIYAVADGVVTVSSEAHYDFGVAVVINSNIEGKSVTMTYAHMSYGTRTVAQGQNVHAGQVIGYVGTTGRSTANHLHLEVNVNGTFVDPYAYLAERAK